MIAAHHLRISPKHGFPFRVLPKPPEPTAKVRKSSSSPDQKFSILETISPFWFRQSWRLISGNSCHFPRFLAKKGGVGCFLTKIPRMLLIWLMLEGGYLVCFARFCDTFCDVFARAARSGRVLRKGRPAKTGLAFVVSHPCLANSKYGQGYGKGRAPGFSCECDGFSDIFLHGVCPPEDYFYCALLGVNCMQSWHELFCGISGLF